jgi:glutamate dehydrogenase
VLGLADDVTALPPHELVSAILRAPVDLLYNGGIGTYVKASDETHAEVGDRANDALRIDATQLRCKVVAEGGNLGFTQRGRIEYARAGGRINTDAIDNSGGVDTSDHEVNIKILLDLPVAEGVLTTKQRNEFLATMTDDVAALVLADNYEQTEILSVGRRLAPRLLDDEARFMRFLEREGRLHRAIEFLPTDDVLAERAASGEGLSTPERAVLLAYAKLWLYDELLASQLPEDPWVAKALVDYFPPALVEHYGAFLPRHPLRREIIATVVVNRTINRAGATFVHRMREATGAGSAEVVRAHMLAREVFALPSVWRDIEALDMQVADDVQAAMLIDTGRLATRGTLWFLRSPRLAEDMAATIARFAPGVASLAERVFDLLPGASRDEALRRATEFESARVPKLLARRVATLEALAGAPDIVETAAATGHDVAAVGGVCFALGDRLALDWLSRRIAALPAEGHWQGLARSALRDDVAGLQRALTIDVLHEAPGDVAVDARLAAWESAHRAARDRALRVVEEVRGAPSPDLAMVSVALRELRNLVASARPGARRADSLT